MITATLKVHAGDGWVAAIGDYDVVGQGIAWSFRDRQFIGITALDAARSDFHDVVETIREHDVTEWLDVIERYDTEDGRTLGSIITKCTYTSYTPGRSSPWRGSSRSATPNTATDTSTSTSSPATPTASRTPSRRWSSTPRRS
ncbi:hypothetical protein VB773_18690 [Haloarculaceae archaeon H-GB2-1]|nr:hypothetical protein [Haloarculaceae archaeon H-GB11]MEA5409398.1 hypothetical protein [Haloarculaceae archaeon H-GB2-1]